MSTYQSFAARLQDLHSRQQLTTGLDGTVEIWAKNAQYLIPAARTKLAECDDRDRRATAPGAGAGVAPGSIQLTTANFSRFRHLILSHAVKFIARSRDPFTR